LRRNRFTGCSCYLLNPTPKPVSAGPAAAKTRAKVLWLIVPVTLLPVAQRDGGLTMLKIDPLLDTLSRGARMNLPE
jgi:hypothetical protein